MENYVFCLRKWFGVRFGKRKFRRKKKRKIVVGKSEIRLQGMKTTITLFFFNIKKRY